MATRQSKNNGWPLGDWLVEHRGKMSRREAARRADISESRWRQVELGYQQMAGGYQAPVHPRPETVVAMARAINADPKRGLELAGHDVGQYAHLLEQPALGNEADLAWFTTLPREEREQVMAELQRLHLDTELGKSKPAPRRARGA